VRAYVAAQAEADLRGDVLLRAGEPEAVHDTRVAVRRLRSMLRVFPALGQVAAAGLAERLKEWSDQLGAVRDLEALAELLAEVCPPPLWDRLCPAVEAERAGAAAALVATLESAGHRRLREEVAALALAEPGPLGARSGARRAARKAAKRLRSAGDDAALLHAARRAAKRARYAAEAIGDADGAARWEAVQERLGTHHDCVVALARLDGVPGADAEQARGRLRDRMATATPG